MSSLNTIQYVCVCERDRKNVYEFCCQHFITRLAGLLLLVLADFAVTKAKLTASNSLFVALKGARALEIVFKSFFTVVSPLQLAAPAAWQVTSLSPLPHKGFETGA